MFSGCQLLSIIRASVLRSYKSLLARSHRITLSWKDFFYQNLADEVRVKVRDELIKFSTIEGSTSKSDGKNFQTQA